MAGSGSLKPSHRGAPYVGREHELAFLIERLEAAARGEGGLVLVNGEPGIGKTRLLAEIGAGAREAGWLVLSGRAYDTESMPAYLPFIEALRQHVGSAVEEDLLEPLQGIPPFADLIPGLRRADLVGSPVQPLPPDAERLRVFNAISECFLRTAASASTPGLLLALDDLHWAERSSLQLLLHLARKLSEARFLVVGTYRAEAAGPSTPLSEMLAALTRERLDARIALGPLSEAEAAALIADIGGSQASAPVAHALYEWTRGNPLYVEEVVRHSISEGHDFTSTTPPPRDWGVPGEVREVIEQRLTRLTTVSQRVVQAASVIGDSFATQFLRQVCELGDEALIEGLEELAGTGVLREEDTRYAFSHPLVREVVYSGVSLARRQHLHRRAAEALQARTADQAEYELAAIGQHWRRGGEPERAVECLLRAGDAAVTLTGWAEAARYWQDAHECMEQAGYPPAECARLLEALGDLYFIGTFEAAQAVSLYEQAIPLYEAAGDPLAAARSHSKAGRCLAYPAIDFDAPAALEHIKAAHQVLGPTGDSFEVGELLFALAHTEQHALRARTDEVLNAIERLGSIAEKLDNGFLRVAATSLRGHYLLMEGHLAEGIALETRACEEAEALAASGMNLWPRGWREALRPSGDGAASAPTDSSVQIARYYPSFLRPYTINCCGLQSLDLGDPLTARAKHERICDARGRFLSPFLMFDLFLAGEVETLRQCADPEGQLLSPLGLAKQYAPIMLSWCDGRWEQVTPELERFVSTVRRAGSDSLTMFAERWLARLYRVSGDVSAVRADLEDKVATAARCGAVKMELPLRAEIALIEAESGRLDESEQQLARCREILAAGEDWLGMAGRVALAEAVLAAARGSHEDAESLFERATEIFGRFALPWDEAEAHELWARAGARFLRGRNRRAFVAEKLGAAQAVYERIGAGQPWLDRLQEMERRGRKGGAISDDHSPAGLSARQAQVLRLIAEGKTNGEIADELVISLRTVERHVAELYAKIGVRNRVEAAAFAMSQLAKA